MSQNIIDQYTVMCKPGKKTTRLHPKGNFFAFLRLKTRKNEVNFNYPEAVKELSNIWKHMDADEKIKYQFVSSNVDVVPNGELTKKKQKVVKTYPNEEKATENPARDYLEDFKRKLHYFEERYSNPMKDNGDME